MTIPQGIWQASSNVITPVSFSGISPVSVSSSSSGVIISNAVASTTGRQEYSLATDFTTTASIPGNAPFNLAQVIISFSYTPTISNGLIQFSMFFATSYASTSTGASGIGVSLYNSSVVGGAPLYVNTLRAYSVSGSSAVNVSNLNYTYNTARNTLPSTITFYVSGYTSTGGGTATFISTSSPYFGGTSGCFVLVNCAI